MQNSHRCVWMTSRTEQLSAWLGSYLLAPSCAKASTTPPPRPLVPGAVRSVGLLVASAARPCPHCGEGGGSTESLRGLWLTELQGARGSLPLCSK